uniref:Acetyl-CoA carboxylase carboxyltransferase beta subunit n=1 Tax=Balanophora yakushimensis TaxID=1128105 RepID=UPI002001706A|nr:Acetyl-CoA carboxylase carboxyltransferase beta subunit [Balanophora yakushimensis]UNQ87784.1 Acetyl-CoA carboxylase carboxyltransferase beta subunit [Balanophora yakushimensis]
MFIKKWYLNYLKKIKKNLYLYNYINIKKINNNKNKYKNLWIQCENCFGLNYKKFFKSKMNICEQCGYHLKINSLDRIDLLINLNTYKSINENIISLTKIEFYSEEENYKNYLSYYQKKTGLYEAIHTGIGKLYKKKIALGIMDFNFMGGSMGTVVGEKITRLIEYSILKNIPLLIFCSSGGARMQEGSLSLIQMAKISSILYKYKKKNKIFISILTSPTTGGVLASFGMLGDIIISEPNTYIAFAGKRVIEQTLNQKISEKLQKSEYLFNKGIFDIIVPRNILKNILNELINFHI